RASRLRRRRHLRDLRAAAATRRDDQPPAARRPHGLRALARRHLDRTAAEGRLAAAARALGVDAEHRRVVDAGRSERRALFRAGQRRIFPILPGSAAWALISGVAMVKGGLPAGWAVAMTFLVYGASAQLAALPLIVAGAPLWVIIATGF